MKTPRYSVLLAASCLALRTLAQSPLMEAVAGPTLAASPGANDNRSAVVYNPDAGLYYSLDAGCKGFPADTYDEHGTFLGAREQGFNYRGAWWNPATAQLEGNGYAEDGIFVQTLDGNTQHPTSAGEVVLSAAQPSEHSVGALDAEADEIIYYHNGTVHRYARSTNLELPSLPITGLPVDLWSVNDNSIAYTGNPGYEYGLYDFAHRRVLFINKTTGAYAGYCQLPASAPARISFGMSYANGLFWLFDAPTNPGTWRGYQVFSPKSVVAEQPVAAEMSIFPVPANELLCVQLPEASTLTDVRVMDSTGRLVAAPLTRTGTGTVQLDVQALRPGTYGLEVLTADGATRRSFVVAR